MCMIQGFVDSISATKILVSVVNEEPNKQLVVYSNKVNIKAEPVAMVLPFPNHSKNNFVKVLETTKATNDVFRELKEIFQPVEDTFGSLSTQSFSSRSVLKVHKSGNYSYSIVNRYEDFDLIDNSVFKLTDPNLQSVLRHNYTDFGFIVCIIDKSAEYTPFAYITEKMPYNTFFIPTRHYHVSSDQNQDNDDDEQWDHDIYVLGAMYHITSRHNRDPFRTVVPRHRINRVALNAFKGYIPPLLSEYCFGLTVNGSAPNIDLMVQAV